jgi:hypothetical protein
VAVAGLAAGLWFVSAGDAWLLDAPQALTVESGDAALWGGSTLESVALDEKAATVRLKTRNGVMERKLAYRDAAQGTKHFALDADGVKSDLSFDPRTREYFFAESGKAYRVKAHGWLKAAGQSVAVK